MSLKYFIFLVIQKKNTNNIFEIHIKFLLFVDNLLCETYQRTDLCFLCWVVCMMKILISSFLGSVSVFAGNGQAGRQDGAGTIASFNHPYNIAIDQRTGNLFVCDYGNHLIRKITPQGILPKYKSQMKKEKNKERKKK